MNIVEYIFTAHARDRMRERNISAEEVRLVTNNPDMSYPGTKGETNNMKIIKGRNIRVVFVGEEPKKIITVMIVGQPGEAK
jgi:mRNA-degrading endonuclease RelE of RelBE toxin-antitoxin system